MFLGKMIRSIVSITILILGVQIAGISSSITYPYGLGEGDSHTSSGDDSYQNTNLGTNIAFYGESYSSVLLCHNGYLGFGQRDDCEFSQENFPITLEPMIAILWADINIEVAGDIYWREDTTQDILDQATNDVRTYLTCTKQFEATSVYIATWDNVAEYGGTPSIHNTMQCVVISDGSRSFVFFNYGEIMWADSATVGLNKDDGLESSSHAASGLPAIEHVEFGTNIGVVGRYGFEVTNTPSGFLPIGVPCKSMGGLCRKECNCKREQVRLLRGECSSPKRCCCTKGNEL